MKRWFIMAIIASRKIPQNQMSLEIRHVYSMSGGAGGGCGGDRPKFGRSDPLLFATKFIHPL